MLKQVYRIPFMPLVAGCVFKLNYDGKYIIVKGKNMETSATQIQKSINQFMRETAGQHKKDNLYIHLFNYVRENPGKYFSYDLIEENESAYQLLIAEQKSLTKARKDKNCLNNNTEAYIPQYNEITEKFGWIAKADVLNFKKWLLKNSKARKKKEVKKAKAKTKK